MTVKVLVLYTQPENADEFDKQYLGVHMPLVDKIPGLQRAESCRLVQAGDAGEMTYYRSAELWFADIEALNAGMSSAEGRAVSKDYRAIAPPGSRLFIANVD